MRILNPNGSVQNVYLFVGHYLKRVKLHVINHVSQSREEVQLYIGISGLTQMLSKGGDEPGLTWERWSACCLLPIIAEMQRQRDDIKMLFGWEELSLAG